MTTVVCARCRSRGCSACLPVPADSLLGRIWDLEVDGELVPNVEGMCRSVLNRMSAGLSEPLSDRDYQESLAHMLGEAWRLTARYDRSRGSRPGPWLHMRVGGALIDHWRSYHGRHGEKRVADLRRLEQQLRELGFDDEDPGVHRSDRPVGGSSGDAGADRVFPRSWSDDEGDLGADWQVGGLGVDAGAPVAAGADRRGDRRGQADGRVGGGGAGAAAFTDCGGCGWRSYALAPNGVPGWHMPDRCAGCGERLT